MSYITKNNDIGAARIYGIAFICAFISYGLGNATAEGVLTAPDIAQALADGKVTYILAIISMNVVHTFANITVATIMFKIMAPFSRFLATGYLALTIIATASLTVGGVLLALVVPASDLATLSSDQFTDLVSMLHASNFYLYQTGMTIWGVGGLLMCVVLWRNKLVPNWLPAWGVLGYAMFIFGTMSEFFNSGIGVNFSLLGGLFEVGLSVYLIMKGFDYSKAKWIANA